jgi:hypothetical protein
MGSQVSPGHAPEILVIPSTITHERVGLFV